jgi:hypothetical protein
MALDFMVSKKNVLIICGVVVAVVCVLFTVLWQAGFVVADHTVVQGKGLVPVGDSNITDANESFLNLFFYLMNQTKSIPGIEKLTMQIFYSNDSASAVENQYKSLMSERGYTLQPQYCASFSKYGQTISYNTYTRGITGVVVFVSPFLGRTWVCYVTGNVFDLLQVYNYMGSHGYLQ